jgi:hypothetical protein
MADAGLGGFLTKRLEDRIIFEFDRGKHPPTRGRSRRWKNDFAKSSFFPIILPSIILPKNPFPKNGFVPNDFVKTAFLQIIPPSMILQKNRGRLRRHSAQAAAEHSPRAGRSALPGRPTGTRPTRSTFLPLLNPS